VTTTIERQYLSCTGSIFNQYFIELFSYILNTLGVIGEKQSFILTTGYKAKKCKNCV
jgi:hypothetical protein